jgi:DNA-binding transcriptional LysR family regulator
MANLLAYRAFARAYELGSFSAVARELGLTQSTVSKHIAALEAELRVQLFARTTRKLNPTEDAARLYEGVLRLLDAADAVQSTGGSAGAEPSGVLRVTFPDSYGRAVLMPLVPRFLARYPRVRMDVRFTDRAVDLIEEGVELGIRVGDLDASSLVARPLGIADHLVVASPRYLQAQGEPRHPVDLQRHNCIVYTGFSRGNRWVFDSEDGRQLIDVPSTLGVNSADAMYAAAAAGVGIARVPSWVVGNDIARGRVRALLTDYTAAPLPINFIYPHSRVPSKRARSFIDFVLAEVKKSAG